MFFFQAEDGIRDLVRSRGLGDVYKRQIEYALTGGDDYELGFTVPEQATVRLQQMAAEWTLSLIHI